ncbi:MAG: aspartate--tRNA ligase [Planctomycetota bacterium]
MTSDVPLRGQTDHLEPTAFRTHSCGELRSADEGKNVKLAGWVNSRRDHGGLIFVDLRDRSGKVQVVFRPERAADAFAAAEALRSEWVIQIEGEVALRGADLVNPKLATGEIEINVDSMTILSRAETPPFEIEGGAEPAEDTRLKWRFIDLRRAKMQRALAARHRAIRAVREFLSARGFLEVETPLLGKSTPEGARDYLVPVRTVPGRFYALPQSPQLYKQLLMVAGLDRYFQIAKCLRDEDSRADRQPEFTQVDLEMSFASVDDVLGVTEGLIAAMFREGIGVELPVPFPRLSYPDAVAKYGDDKPDLRFDIEMIDAPDFARTGEFIPFKRALDEGGIVRALRGVEWGSLSRREIDNLIGEVRGLGAGGMAWARVKGGTLEGGVAKNFPDEARRDFVKTLGAEEGDIALFVGGARKTTLAAMAYLRNRLGEARGWKARDRFAVEWIVDFPLFSWNEEDGRWESEHHPFTAPHPDDADKIESDPGAVRSLSYDLVINGSECASGSVRIHDPELQKRIFTRLGLADDEIEAKFGFFRGALAYGAPPHAGVAPGVDRIMAIMAGVESIRDVIAFPKTQRGADLMTGAPGEVDARQLRDLGVSVVAQPAPDAGPSGNDEAK